ncbi:MAG: DNA alkylation repair protein [Deltaproteobacteria bacterium]|nr:DNA alkylation repair protein [Deltaproteobacteria bacterium]
MKQIEIFKKAFRAEGTKKRAEKEKAYLKSNLNFHGVTVPFIRKTGKAFYREHKDLSHDELINLVEELWATDFHDLHTLGIVLLQSYADKLEADDIAMVENLIRKSNTWDHVDGLSAWIAGSLVTRYKSARRVLTRWSKDDNFWIRRASMLAQLAELREGKGDFNLFAKFASSMIEEKEFFIRKAIGWVLREVSKKRPELSYNFLLEHIDRVSGLTLREGSRKLPEKQQTTLKKHDKTRHTL